LSSAEKKVQEARLLSKEQFKRAIEEAPIPTIMLAEDGQVLQINRSWTELTGYKIGDIPTFDNWIKCLVNGGADAVRNRMRDLFKGIKRTINVDFSIRTLHGDIRVWSFSASSPGTLLDGKRFIIGMAVDVTERKNAEEALRKSEERFSMAQRVARVGTFEWNIQTGVNTWTPELEAMYGLAEGTFAGTQEAWEQLVYPEDRLEMVKRVSEAIKTGGFEGEWRVVWPDGSIHWINGRAWVFKDEKGKPLRLIGVNIDITESKKREEILEESESRYHSLFSNLIDGFAYCEMIYEDKSKPIDFVYIEINDAFERLTGLRRENVVGRKVSEAIPGTRGANPEIFGLFSRVVQTGVPERFELFFKPLSKWFDIAVYSPRKGHFVASFENITERKRAEEAIKTLNDDLEERVRQRTAQVSSERLRLYNVLETLPSYVILLDRDYRVVFANKVFRETFGEDHGRRCHEYLFGKDSECENCVTYKVYRENKAQHWYWTGPNGHNYDIYDFPFKEADGSTLILEMGIDITEQRKAEKQAKDSERLAAIGATAAMIGHDIRNPLQAMIGDIYLLKDYLTDIPETATKNDVVESLEQIEKNVGYINKIVTDLQDYSRAITPELLNINLYSLVIDAFRNIEIPENVAPLIKIDSKIKLKTDCTLLARILTNLIINAIQAMPKGGKLSIVAAQKQNNVVISVEDTGVGIPEHVKPKLFTPMMTTKSKGQGLGLAVVKRLVEALNGDVKFESEEGKGTKFVIELPINE